MNSLSQRTLVIAFYSKNLTRRSGLHTMSAKIFSPSSYYTCAFYRMAIWLGTRTSMWQIPVFGSGQWWICKQNPMDTVLSSHWSDGIRYQCSSCRGENPAQLHSFRNYTLPLPVKCCIEFGPALIWHEDIYSSDCGGTNLAYTVSFITHPFAVVVFETQLERKYFRAA